MNKKGFTLIELIALISIIAIIMLVAFPNMTNQLKKARENNYKTFEQNVFLATETYINTYRSKYAEFKNIGDQIEVSIDDLINSGYLRSSTINPETNEKISPTNYVTVTITDDMTYQYKFNY